MGKLELCRYLDSAVLKPELNQSDAREAILSGIQYRVRSVCVRPCDITMAVELCKGSETEVSCVLSFPHGCSPESVKAFEAKEYVRLGVNEIDMVANYGYIRSGLYDLLESEVRAVVAVAKPAGVLVKVILETCTLANDEIALATEASIRAGAAFVKTSTGFHATGATEGAVRVMVETAKDRIEVKASGGIRDKADAWKFIDMGCTRLGVGYSTTPLLCTETNESSKETY